MNSDLASQKTVLLVEDDHDTRVAMRDCLESQGYRVVSAGHGGEALSLLAGGYRPGLILLDLMMPVKSGYEVLREVRRNPELALTPVMICSAYHEGPALPGAIASLPKPVDMGRMMALVTRHCA